LIEPIVHALLRRYGVVFWRILQRESAWLPPWRELLRVLRRLEARGDVRGGAFRRQRIRRAVRTARCGEGHCAMRGARRFPASGSH
jgi:hypothetical protein